MKREVRSHSISHTRVLDYDISITPLEYDFLFIMDQLELAVLFVLLTLALSTIFWAFLDSFPDFQFRIVASGQRRRRRACEE